MGRTAATNPRHDIGNLIPELGVLSQSEVQGQSIRLLGSVASVGVATTNCRHGSLHFLEFLTNWESSVGVLNQSPQLESEVQGQSIRLLGVVHFACSQILLKGGSPHIFYNISFQSDVVGRANILWCGSGWVVK